MKQIFSAEYISNAHPDKLADLISDSIVDEHLRRDPNSHVACETLISNQLIVLAGEIKSNAKDIPYKDVIDQRLKECGYDMKNSGFDCSNYQLIMNLNQQSEDIDYSVNHSYGSRNGESDCIEDRLGAGDQGIVIGYACNETEEMMPLPQMIAKSYIEEIDSLRKKDILSYLRPVSKTLITMKYEDRKPIAIENIVVSVQHEDRVSIEQIHKDIMEKVIHQGRYVNLINKDTSILINPSGRFCIGGPKADTGVTGRKIIVDTYGGRARHGGGAFSGKDPSKVDRSGAYLARWIAKHIVGLGYAKECEVELQYAIGVAKPINIAVNCFGTEIIKIDEIISKIYDHFDLRLYSVMKELDLLKPRYVEVTKKGHFGMKDDFSWEVLSKKM